MDKDLERLGIDGLTAQLRQDLASAESELDREIAWDAWRILGRIKGQASMIAFRFARTDPSVPLPVAMVSSLFKTRG